MEITSTLMVILLVLLGMASGMMLMYSLIKNTRHVNIGTLIIDTRSQSKDICRFMMDTDLDTISKYEHVSMKVVRLSGSDNPLVSFKDYD